MLCLLALLAASAAASANQTTDEQARRAHAIASKVMSPFCPGSTVSTCTSPRAAEWRADIETWVKEGKSEAEIRQLLAARTPTHDLSGTPRTSLGWGLPIILAAAALALLWWLLRRFARARPAAEPQVQLSEEPKLDEQLDRELHELDD